MMQKVYPTLKTQDFYLDKSQNIDQIDVLFVKDYIFIGFTFPESTIAIENTATRLNSYPYELAVQQLVKADLNYDVNQIRPSEKRTFKSLLSFQTNNNTKQPLIITYLEF